MISAKKYIPGISLCLSIAIPSYFAGHALPIIGGPIFGILAGMLLRMLFPGILQAGALESGVKYTSKKLLQGAIILLGFEMNLFYVIQVGGKSLLVMLFTLSASFLTAFLAGRALKVNGKMAILIGVGTSICGGSAIAATAPIIRAEDEDFAQAVSTIFLFNIAAVFIFPALGHLLSMSDTGFGMWAGTAINDTSSVVAAGASWSSAAGNNTALAFATIVKLTRTLMIVPIALVLAIITVRKDRASSPDSAFRAAKVFPWFVIGFVAAAAANTFLGIPAPVSGSLAALGKFMIIMAMTAIGLSTHLKKLIANGTKPMLLGLCCWFAVASVSLLVQTALKIW